MITHLRQNTTTGSVTLTRLIEKKTIYVRATVRKREQKITNWEKAIYNRKFNKDQNSVHGEFNNIIATHPQNPNLKCRRKNTEKQKQVFENVKQVEDF